MKIRQWERIFFNIKEEDLLKARKAGGALADYLQSSPEWQPVYNDGLAEIFIKK
jgi:hypothetical protein